MLYVLKVNNQAVGQYDSFAMACAKAKKHCAERGDIATVWGEVNEVGTTLVYLCANQHGNIVDCYPWGTQL